MENNQTTSNKMLTMEQMTREHFAKYPEQPVESIKEYLRSIAPQEKNKVVEKLKASNAYYKQFQEAILQTSFIITLALQHAISPELEVSYDNYVREFLYFSRNDDKLIYNMRLYYLSNLTAEEMGIGYIEPNDLADMNEQERQIILASAKKSQQDYNALLASLITQYSQNKQHL